MSKRPSTIIKEIVAYIGMMFGRFSGRNGAYLMYGNTSAGVVVGGVLLSDSFYMCPTVECIPCSEYVYTAHCMKP